MSSQSGISDQESRRNNKIRCSLDLWILSAIIVFTVISLTSLDFTQDDTFISLRYARNFSLGYGLRFNPTENPPVEGFTNLLWTLMLAAPFYLKTDPLIYTKILGLCSGCFLLTIASALLFAYTGSRILTRIGVWVLALNVTLGLWSVAGMETVLFSGFILAAMLAVPGLFGNGFRVMPAVAWSFLAVLTRPEGVIPIVWIAVILATLAFKRGMYRRAARYFVLWMGILGAGYAVWKLLYFHSIIPNTFVAKVSTDTGARLESGFQYLKGWFIHWAWPLVILALPAFRLQHRKAENWLLGGFCLLMLSYVWIVGGDFMRYHRFLLPVLGPVMVLAMGGLKAGHVHLRNHPHAAVVYPSILFLILSGAAYFSPNLSARYHHIRTFDPAEPLKESTHRDTILGEWLRTTFPPSTRLAIFNIGRIPFYSRLHTIDTLGLTDPVIAKHLRDSDTCGLAREVLSRMPQIIIPQGQEIICLEERNWKLLLLGDWKGIRQTMGISPILNPERMADSELARCPEIILTVRERYDRVRFTLNHSTMVLYFDEDILEEFSVFLPPEADPIRTDDS
ncbi:hypothetical protein JXA40_04010 [bacterium]|nr:hypothetical protein [candidate division CSSED10-310 bacterium]